MTGSKPKKKRGRPKGSKNKRKTNLPSKENVKKHVSYKTLGRPKGSKTKRKIIDEQEQTPILETVVNDSTSNLFTINEHELFNIISDEDSDIKHVKIKTGTIFGLSVEGIKNGRIYFSLKSLKRR